VCRSNQFLAAEPDLFSDSSNQVPDFTCRCLTARSRTNYTLGIRSRLFNPNRTFCLVDMPVLRPKDNENAYSSFRKDSGAGQLTVFPETTRQL
jgi:hypothetical protein